MAKYKVKGRGISKPELISSVDEVYLDRKGASENEFPFRVGIDWFWAIFDSQFRLTGLERYGFNDETNLFNWCGGREIFLVEVK